MHVDLPEGLIVVAGRRNKMKQGNDQNTQTEMSFKGLGRLSV